MQRGILAAMCALVIGVYAYMARSNVLLSGSLSPADNYYNLLAQGFRSGHLSLKKEAPPGLAQLADPYDPVANYAYQFAPYGLLDLSYYNGRLYLYFGVTPALILFWPYAVLTGRYLSYGQGVAIFCAVGFLASVSMLRALWRRYFAEVSVWMVATVILALGLATGVLAMLVRCKVNEVAISCGYALAMVALAAIWQALHHSSQRARWLAAASLAYGLAVGARPTLLFGAVILLVPVAQAWRQRPPRHLMSGLIAAITPIALIGCGLMLYNALRFGSLFEFGLHYQLAPQRQVLQHLFNLQYVWFNAKVYFLEPARWSGRFPFLHDIALPPLPKGQAGVEHPFGVLTNIPLVWFVLAAPLAWRGRSGAVDGSLRWFVMAVALLFGICAFTTGLYNSAIIRYEVEFLPALVLLAVIGVLALERWLVGRPGHRMAGPVVRWGWCLLLSLSVMFNLLATVGPSAEWHYDMGAMLVRQGKVQEAIRHWEQASRLNPDSPVMHNNLGAALLGQGRLREAISHFEQALRIKPDYAEAHYNLGLALAQLGQMQQALEQYEQALHLQPDYAEAHNSIGLLLVRQGRLPEAIRHWEQALRVNPDFAEALNNLGLALMGQGRRQEAIEHYEQALRIKPDYAEAHHNLAIALDHAGRVPEAIDHYEQALRIKPDLAEVHYNLGVALKKLGRTAEAIEHYELALRIQPDFVEAKDALALAQAVQ